MLHNIIFFTTSEVGSLDQFNLQVDDWELYIERFEIFCKANEIKSPEQGESDGRIPALLSLVGADTYKRIRALVAPTNPSEATFATLKTVLKNKTKPKPTQLAERFRFHKSIQNEVEDVVTFNTALREISVNCGFADVNDRLRDQLVIGLRKVKIKSELLSKDTVT